MEELEINRLKLLLLAFLLVTISSCVGTAAELRVHPGETIQAAVNNAHSGDTIIVEPGTYAGNIDISKTNDLNNLVLMSASGKPEDTTIIAENSAAATVQGVISITKFKTNVTVNGFTIRGARDNMAGVYLDQGKQCTITNNVFINNGFGVRAAYGSNNVISNNIISRTRAVEAGTPYVGITIDNSGNAMISQNIVSNLTKGIRVSGSISKATQVKGNSASKNAEYGILLENGVRGVYVNENTLESNELAGIYLAGSSENFVTNNKVVMPGLLSSNGINTNAIQLIVSNSVGSDSNIVSNNKVSNADHGIFLNGCKNNTIQQNTAFNNNYGIAMRYSHNNRIINNIADGNINGNNGEGIFLTYEDSRNTILNNSASGCIAAGIHLSQFCGAENVIDNNVVNSNQYNGIYIEAPNNKITNNILSQNSRGILLAGPACRDNWIYNNIVKEGYGNGIYLMNTSDNNKIVGNGLVSNAQKGIDLYFSNNSYIDRNYAQDNDMGIQLEFSEGVTVINNRIYENRIGTRVYYSANNTISSNNVTYNRESGVDLNSAMGNSVTGNQITWNDKGISMCPACRNNLVYNNYFNNYANTGVQNAQNTWNTAKTRGKNIMGGPYIGGNFWASPGGDGFSQTAHDVDGDGISNTVFTYTSPAGITITDMLPLVSVLLPVAEFSVTTVQGTAPLTVQFTDNSQNADSRIWNFGDGTNSTEQNPAHTYSAAGTYTATLTVNNKNDTVTKNVVITVQEYVAPPVADFSANPMSGSAPLTVQFSDNSQNAAGWSWSFGDGATSNEKSPSHIYNADGTYNVNLVVSNGFSTNSKAATIIVQTESSSSGGSSGGSSHSSGSSGGGGGAGGSPEPQTNVEIKELSQTFVSSGKAATFDFPQKATAVVSIGFDSKRTAGKTTTIVEMLKAKSTLVSAAPADEVYKYLNIWVGNSGFATEKNIENAVVTFKVAKSWVQDKNIDKSSITLNRYSDKTWSALLTSLSSEDDNYMYFSAQTPRFSSFAITGKSAASSIQPSVEKTEPAVNVTQNNTSNGSAAANSQKTPEQKESTSPSPKQSTSLPGFEAVFGIAVILAAFLYRRK